MSQKGRTPDEKFLIELYRTSMDRGVDIHAVGRACSLRETAVKNIVKELAQANFIQKLDARTIVLTSHGRAFVLQELE